MILQCLILPVYCFLSLENTKTSDTRRPATKTNKPGEPTNPKMKTKTVGLASKAQSTSRPSTSKAFVKQPVLLRKNKLSAMKTTYGATYGKSASSSRPGSGTKNTTTAKTGGAGSSNNQGIWFEFVLSVVDL